MKSRCLLNSCNSTSQFISIMFRCSFFFFYFNQIKNFLFLLLVNLCMITGIYLHDPPPFNGPFFMTPPFFEAQKGLTPPPPLLISDKSLTNTLVSKVIIIPIFISSSKIKRTLLIKFLFNNGMS